MLTFHEHLGALRRGRRELFDLQGIEALAAIQLPFSVGGHSR
jgi:hypothetical protein